MMVMKTVMKVTGQNAILKSVELTTEKSLKAMVIIKILVTLLVHHPVDVPLVVEQFGNNNGVKLAHLVQINFTEIS